MSENKRKVSKKKKDADEGNVEESKVPQDLEALKEQAEEYLNGWKRAQADYQNLQKQVSEDRDRMRHIAKLTTMLQILPLFNNFELAVNHLPESLHEDDWAKGIVHIRDQFTQILSELGVTRITIEQNQAFDPLIHEAMSQEMSDEHESGTIIREVSPGYEMDGETVVPSKVIVAE